MRDAFVIGAGMTRFGKYLDRNMKSLAEEAVTNTLEHAGIDKKDLQAAWVGNAAQGLVTGQEGIRGQVVLRPLGIDAIPIMNVENACASASSAFYGAWMGVASGMYDCALVLGMEKLFMEDKKRTRARAAPDRAVARSWTSIRWPPACTWTNTAQPRSSSRSSRQRTTSTAR